MIFDTNPKNLEKFWDIIPHTFDGFDNKTSLPQFVCRFLFHCFYHEHRFYPLKDIPEVLITEGLKRLSIQSSLFDVQTFFQQRRKIRRYQKSIRHYFGFRLFHQNDIKKIQKNFSVLYAKRANEDYLKTVLDSELVRLHIERVDDDELESLILEIRRLEEKALFKKINATLSHLDRQYLDHEIISRHDSTDVVQWLRQDAGAPNRTSVEAELKCLDLLQKLVIELFAFIDPINTKQAQLYKRRFLNDTPGRYKRRTRSTQYALALIFLRQRYRQTLDNLIDYLSHFAHQIKKTADKKNKKLQIEIAKRLGDLDCLYQIAEINRDHPKDIIEQAVYPKVSQASIDRIIQTREFARQSKQIIKETVIKRYSMNYRFVIFRIITHLKFQSSDRDLLQAITLIKKYQHSRLKHYSIKEVIPLNHVLSKPQQQLVSELVEGKKRILRKDYECAVLKSLRKKLNHKEIWVEGSPKYGNPKDDFPEDFDANQEMYYNKLGMPLSATVFIDNIKALMREHIQIFDTRFPQNDLVNMIQKKGKPWIKLTPLEKAPEPQEVRHLKKAVLSEWGFINLLDILKEVDLRESFTQCFNTVGNRQILSKETIRKRLLMCIFAIGTNTGLKRAAGASKGQVTFEELRHIKKFFINKEDLREAINKLVNAIFRIRDPAIWRSVSTACAGDSKQFGCYNQNLISEWSPRHHADGVMIYWHVNDQSVCVYSQLKTCTSSEVASMLQGIVGQETNMEIQSQYVDSHGKSELGFALSHLLQFKLLPRYKTIGREKLYLPSDDFEVKHITNIITRAIRWDIIENQYNELIKHTVAVKIGTATADTVIRKFARTNYQHPTFKAFIELGKAIKTIFLCRYLDSVELRQQINAGLNVVENWNSANDFIYYGKSGEFASNVREDQEVSMLCLHLTQTCITYLNTLFVERLFKKSPHWKQVFKEEDFRALTALFYLHINPYGTLELNLDKQLTI